jgi:hypothetical protein
MGKLAKNDTGKERVEKSPEWSGWITALDVPHELSPENKRLVISEELRSVGFGRHGRGHRTVGALRSEHEKNQRSV